MENKTKENQVRLTQLASAAGCGAKIGPKVLAQVVGKLPKFTDPMLLVGPETSDDAAVYKINDELAMIHTVDFFPPVVDDPYMYGQIAAANALSDVYAMGGVPKLALNVVAFPNCLGPEVLEQILRGGADKVMEAGAVLAGGHTINDKEPKYGLCVTGYVHPDKMWKNYGAETGDILILTKPLGCGILNTAIKAEMAAQEEIERVQKIMAKLNKYAAEIASNYTIHSCTDVTGFSLAGHSLEMAKGSHKTLVIQSEKLPVIEGVEEYAQMGLILREHTETVTLRAVKCEARSKNSGWRIWYSIRRHPADFCSQCRRKKLMLLQKNSLAWTSLVVLSDM